MSMSKIGGNLNKVSEKKYFQVRKRKTNTIYYHMWNLSGKQKWTQGRREQTSVCQGGRSWGRAGLGVWGYKLLYVEWINNKVLPYSTGNYIQYPVINHNGKEDKRECI